MDGKQLKNSILQWAIQGKLVSQNPKDEPAQKLLEKIALSRHSERSEESSKRTKKASTSLRGAKATKQSKALSSRIYRENGVWYEQVGTATPKDISDEIPFEIPENWAWCRLKNICSKFSTGPFGTMLHKEDYVENNGIPLVNPTNIKNGKISSSGIKCVNVDKYKELSSYVLTEGDLVIARRGDLSKCAIVGKEENAWLAGTGAFFLRPEKIDLAFFVKFYTSPYTQSFLTSDSVGSTMDNLNQSLLGDLLTPLPPLAEQKRIVAKLEQVLPLAEEYGAAQEQLDKLNKELPEALKKSILQEAIQGKLVPQNPKDEPASALLAKIRKEKEVLVKQGKLKKKDLEISPINEEEIPFEIPDTWTWCRMGDIGSWGAGATPSKGNPAFYKNGEIPWLVTGELNNSVVAETKTKISKVALEKCSLRLCKPGDVLIAMYGATIGKLAIAGIELTTNQACCACTPHYEYNKYLFYFLMASKPDLIKRGEGGAQPNISKEKLINYLMPLPPLAEQKRIVAKLEQLFKVL